MTNADFLKIMEEAVMAKPGTLTGTERLDQVENWDSMAVVAFIIRANEHCSVALTHEEISRCETVQDLLDLVDGRVAA
jgi:acyl carrier protein